METYTIIIANVFSLVGQLFMLFASTRKTRRDILIYRCIAICIVAVSGLLLKGYTGVVMDGVELARNLLALGGINSNVTSFIFIGISIFLGLLFNNRGIFGVLPIIANIIQSTVILSPKMSLKAVKMGLGTAALCWCVFNFICSDYIGSAFTIVNATSYFINAFRKDDSKNE
ncbi:MAG: YgjV family protein [Erysipelotrichaceae bacterium]|nr:YgjV family protein [Erysipelotrichaceae bacterium]